MWELGHKESGMLKNWCFQIVVLEKTLESPLDNKEIKPIHWKDDAEAETPMLWLSDVKSQLIGKDLDAGKAWSQKEKMVAEDETVR